MTIAEVVADDDRFSTLLAALERVDLDGVLNQDGPFTVFAPTNDAFAGVDISSLSDAQLTNILLYHVLGANVASTDLFEGQNYTTTASTGGFGGTSPTAVIERSGANVTINGSINVTEADIETKNGVIHVIDGVMTPMSIVDIVTSNNQFSQLTDALVSAPGDLPTALSADGPFTVFAPVNAAFQAISGTVAGLTPDQLASVLTYHVVAGNARSNTLSDGDMPTTLQMEDVTININGGTVTVTDANGNVAEVVVADIQGTNGVVHMINMVLIPENL
jgi:transforming growth factor-beta-induced protein